MYSPYKPGDVLAAMSAMGLVAALSFSLGVAAASRANKAGGKIESEIECEIESDSEPASIVAVDNSFLGAASDAAQWMTADEDKWLQVLWRFRF